MKELIYAPSGFWKLDDTTPFQDYSGFSKSATGTGTEKHSLAVAAGNSYSQYFTNTNRATIATDVYVQGKENFPFTLQACVFSTGGKSAILSHLGAYDGLWIDGGTINFTTEYTNQGKATCSYVLPQNKRVTIHGVHTELKNMLYINGELVDEVDITLEQRQDSYKYSGSSLVCGESTSSSIFVNNLAMYQRALFSKDIIDIYNSHTQPFEKSKRFNVRQLQLSYEYASPIVDVVINDSFLWESGTHENCAVEDNFLYAQVIDGLTVEGKWIKPIELKTQGSTVQIKSLDIYWESINATVEYSTNGTNWSTAVKGSNALLNFNPTETPMLIRITLASGHEEAYVSNLRIKGYTSNSDIVLGNTITYSDAAKMSPGHFFDRNFDLGVHNKGTLSISNIESTRTVEIWYRRAGALTLSSNFTGSTKYVNGVASGVDDVGEWCIVHHVLTANTTANLDIGGDVQIERVVLYPTALTAQQVLEVIAEYTGNSKISTVETQTVSITEPVAPANLYAYDWTIYTVR